MVICKALLAESPSGGQGGGELGPIQTNCAKTLLPTSPATPGIGTGASDAPTALLASRPIDPGALQSNCNIGRNIAHQ